LGVFVAPTRLEDASVSNAVGRVVLMLPSMLVAFSEGSFDSETTLQRLGQQQVHSALDDERQVRIGNLMPQQLLSTARSCRVDLDAP